MPETIPLSVVFLNGLVTPNAVWDMAPPVLLFWVPVMLVAVAFEARLTDELPVAPMSFLPLIPAGIVLFMFAMRDISVWPIAVTSSALLLPAPVTVGWTVLTCYCNLDQKK